MKFWIPRAKTIDKEETKKDKSLSIIPSHLSIRPIKTMYLHFLELYYNILRL